METNTQHPPVIEGTLPALARAVAAAFPELNGRCIAVSEVDAFDGETHLPRLPFGLVALVGETSTQGLNSGGHIPIEDDILVQLLFDSKRYLTADRANSPFFAYYDYETVRDRMLAVTKGWRSPRNAGLAFRTMAVESDEYAVSISFRFASALQWCLPEHLAEQPAMLVDRVHARVQPAPAVECDPCATQETEDPCGAG